MITLVVSTRNPHKLAEISAILGSEVRLLGLRELPEAPDIREDAATFAGNARLKAAGIAVWLLAEPSRRQLIGAPAAFVLADDSGLEVDALNGAPGVHSARFAALDTGATGNSSDVENNVKLLRLLGDLPIERRTARFRCAIALTPLPDGELAPVEGRGLAAKSLSFDGACEGHIGFSPRGTNGFGYDPLFTPLGFTETFAELGESTKNRVSHRARTLGALHSWLVAQAQRKAGFQDRGGSSSG